MGRRQIIHQQAKELAQKINLARNMKEEKAQAVIQRTIKQQKQTTDQFFAVKVKEKEKIAAKKEKRIRQLEKKEAKILESIERTQEKHR